MIRKSLALSLLMVVFATANTFAATEAARMTGKVTDAQTKQIIPEAVINLTAIEGKTFKQDFKAKKDGTYAVFVLSGTIRYDVTVSAPGYQPYVEKAVKLKLGGEANLKDFDLTKAGAAAPGSGTVAAVKETADPAVTAYNEGAALANEKNYDGALAKFEETVKVNPDLTAGWIALAKTAAAAKKYPRAIEAANKALLIDDEDMEMWQVLVASYTATGDKAKAKEAQAKLPANAGSTFNDAARAINAGKDGDAEPLLKAAIAADAKFAAAYYELGMLYVRAGKNADAKTNLEKYLELEPNGKDAPTAKEMLAYVK
ncbi:MAG TPA: carboxypeptidase regulatory-like domain-containing protein [Thermoanaerobaculia bacterium]|jgi:tetratricopeptide (TPR) repeat protein